MRLFTAKPGQNVKGHDRRYSWSAFRHFFARRRASQCARTANEILAEIMPARPQVAQHQRSAALHLQLANEINWTGPRFRHPQSWRGR